MCEVLCGARHQEDPPVDDVAQFGGALVRKESGICCCIHDTLMNMHLYMYVYIFHMGTLNLPLILSKSVVLSCMYSMVIVSWSI